MKNDLTEINSSKNTLLNNKNGLPQIFQNWPQEIVNAYILMPHLKGKWYSFDSWCNEKSLNSVNRVIINNRYTYIKI